LPSGPTASAYGQAAIVGDNLYYFGGTNKFFQDSNQLWQFNIPSNTWTELKTQNEAGSPPPREAFIMRAFDDKLIITQGEHFTGTHYIDFTDVWLYDIPTNQFLNITPTGFNPPGISNTDSAAIIHNKLIIFGGDIPGGSPAGACGAPFSQNPTNITWSFDLGSNQWSEIPTVNIPGNLKRAAAGAFNDKMIMFGGYSFSCPSGLPADNGQFWHNSIYELSLSN